MTLVVSKARLNSKYLALVTWLGSHLVIKTVSSLVKKAAVKVFSFLIKSSVLLQFFDFTFVIN